MRAVVQDRYGGPEVLRVEERGLPTLRRGEVLVRVHAAALNPTDHVIMRGLLRPQTGWLRPREQARVRGFDVAGVVESIGPDVAEAAVGDAVFGSARGSLAEYAAASEEKLVRKPERLTFAEAAAITVAGTMALEALRDHAQLRPGQRIAITGSTGGVGSFAVQIAKALGAEVTAVCRTENVELARELGADHVVDYTRQDYLSGTKYDAVFDNGGGRSLRSMRAALAPGGVIVLNCGQDLSLAIAGATARLVLRQRDVKQFGRKVRRDDLLELSELVERGSVSPLVDRTYQLSETPDAMRHLLTRHARGKVVVVP